jgi:thioredoxin-related protein
MKKANFTGNTKKLPVAGCGEEGMEVCMELLSLVYGESEITPIAVDLEEKGDEEDYLTQKYRDQVSPLFLEVSGEIVFPLPGLFDSDMFILNYRKFYSEN